MNFGRNMLAAAFACALLTAVSGCGDDDDDGGTGPTDGEVQLTISNFPGQSPEQGHYEFWISFASTSALRHEAEAVSMGKFKVDTNGAIVGLGGEPDPIEPPSGMTWPLAVDAYITIEPEGDDDPAPSFPGFIAGGMINRSATLTTNGVDGLDTNFASAAGSFVLATPSTSDAMDESEGVWFTSADGMSAALTLPPLPAGWIYEGWVSLSDPGFASLGRFATPVGEDSDLSGPLHGTGGRIDQDGYAFPGSDFPFVDRYSLDTAKTFVTVEPASNADGPGPFILVVLDGGASPGGSGAPFPLTNSSSTLPSATVSIPQQ